MSCKHPLKELIIISNDDGHGNENGKKAEGLDKKKKKTLHVHHAVLYISLPPSFCGGGETQDKDFLFFFFLT